MIEVQITNNYEFTCIKLSCSESAIKIELAQIHISNPHNTKVLVSDVTEPDELSFLKNRYVDLDEMNYLAKRMDGFFGDEEMQFYEALKLEHFTELRDLINLTFNLNGYALITDISDMGKVGREYLLNKDGCLSTDDEDNPKYAEIGRQLLQSGQGIFTDYGLLFPDHTMPFKEVYDGQTFPAYLYDQCLFVGEIHYEDKTEYVYFPDEEISIAKALKRLGADSIGRCNVTLSDLSSEHQPLLDVFETVLKNEDIYAVNDLACAVQRYVKMQDITKLSAVIEYAGVSSAKTVVALAENLDSFDFIKNIGSNEELAQWWLENNDYLEISEELTDYFDFDQYGGDLAEDNDGEFIENRGFVFMKYGESLDDIGRILKKVDKYVKIKDTNRRNKKCQIKSQANTQKNSNRQ